MAAIREVALETGKRSPVRWIIGGLFLVAGRASRWARASSSNTASSILLRHHLALHRRGDRGPADRWARSPAAIGVLVPKVAGLTGRMARDNAIRNPRRTSSTAAAIVLTLMLVSVITIFFSSFTASINASVVKGLKADLEVASESFGFGGLSPELAEQVGELPEVADGGRAPPGLRPGARLVQGHLGVGHRRARRSSSCSTSAWRPGSMADLTGDDTVALSVDESDVGEEAGGLRGRS